MNKSAKLMYLILFAVSSLSFAQQKSAAPKATVAESKISFWDLPNLKEAYISTSPKNLKEGFEVGELGIANENKEANIQFAQELADPILKVYYNVLRYVTLALAKSESCYYFS